ncbi:MAG TPA: hypothetical protein VJV75_11135 [Candidatus Polarisedimenticolia bacterium]|nr:hypothetical protein [Candidatus Polarisedimenticolia bacterium]
MGDVAFEYVVRTRQKTDETYRIEVEKAPGHWIAVVRLPDGGTWNMDRFDPRAPKLPKQWVGGTAAAAADFAARILTNWFASEGMEVVKRTFAPGPGDDRPKGD